MTKFFMNTTPSDNRFDLARFVQWHSDNMLVHNVPYVTELRALPVYGNMTVTTQAARPDLLSWDLYRTTDLWSMLLAYNNLIRVDQIVEGLLVKYPRVSDLESLYFRLVSKQKSMR